MSIDRTLWAALWIQIGFGVFARSATYHDWSRLRMIRTLNVYRKILRVRNCSSKTEEVVRMGW